MKFIPDYRVCYKGTFHECDEEFDIDPADAEEMREHGEILSEPETQEEAETSGESEAQEVPGELEEIAEPEIQTEENPRRGKQKKEVKAR